MKSNTNKKPWLYLMFFLSTLFISAGILFNQHIDNHLKDISRKTKNDLGFISELVKERLQTNNYQLAKDFIIKWGKNTPDIYEIVLTTTNKYKLAHYKSIKQSQHLYSEEINFNYSYNKKARIKLTKNLDAFHKNYDDTLYILLSIFLIITIVASYITAILIRHKNQKEALTTKNSQHIKAEEKLTKSHAALQEREEKLAMTLNAIADGVIVTDNKGKVSKMNPVAETLTGWKLEDAWGKPLDEIFSLIDAITRDPVKYHIDVILSSNEPAHRNESSILIAKDGTEYSITDSISAIKNSSDQTLGVILVFSDITERKKTEEKILYQSHFDALTDLPNRFLSLDRLLQLIIKANRKDEYVSILFIDLDNFKNINDSLGHNIGDKILIEASSRLIKNVRDDDTVGRFGGDEFIILLGGLTEATDALQVIDKLLSSFRMPFHIDGRKLMITASIGISIYPDDGKNPSELLRHADSAMYHSKEKGRNTYSFFTDAMNKDASRRLILEEQMHGALERGEFRLNYQPKTNIDTENIIGVEALLRWKNPQLGEVSPVEFIPIAEQSGMIIDIGRFVLVESLKMMEFWKKFYALPFSIAVNLSPCQFRDNNLIALIKESLNKYNISTEALELEITEGVLLNKHNYVNEVLGEIHDLGINIAMDDFGTGYSSLSYLRSYPFDILKIDRSFVNDITEDNADRELVNASISMAHSLGLKVVAEGVETKEQLALLAQQGCDIAQGYYFSKPVSADEITLMLKINQDQQA